MAVPTLAPEESVPSAAEIATAESGGSAVRTGAAALLVCIVAFTVYVSSPVLLESDSYWTVFTARSLIERGDVDLDEYIGQHPARDQIQLDAFAGHRYYSVPIATSLVTVPVVAVASIVNGDELDRQLANGQPNPTESLAASIVAALVVLMIFLMARRLTTRLWIAVVTSLAFAFGTQAWSTASRAMWMHGPSMLCLSGGLYCALRARESPRWFPALGAVLALASFVRPTNAIPLVAFGIWALCQGRKPFRRYAIAAAGVALVFFAIDLTLYGRLVQPYFRANRLAFSSHTVEALAGNLVSPGRGLIVFVPVVLLCGYGAVAKHRRGTFGSLDVTVVITAVAYWLVVSLFPHWWGGWGFGPRLLSDAVPYVIWFLPSALEAVRTQRRASLAILAALLIVLSVGIQAAGALDAGTAAWNTTPADIDRTPARLWDWTDLQFLR